MSFEILSIECPLWELCSARSSIIRMSDLGRFATIQLWNLSHAFEKTLTGQERTFLLDQLKRSTRPFLNQFECSVLSPGSGSQEGCDGVAWEGGISYTLSVSKQNINR